ncbi:MAG: RNA polymerase sigma factor RpoS, partial [Candidatus Accumulibacter sp.]|nr:RNA polymerase sigma factor RpoS [Accumulibacter sp.]
MESESGRIDGEADFLADPGEEGAASPPEVELLNDVTQHYLNEIGAKPLFTPEEEYLWACRAR